MTPLILKRGDPSRRRDNDYDVLENGVIVGRIFKVPVAPKDRPWMCERPRRAHLARSARLCRDARGRDGSVREEVAQGLARASGIARLFNLLPKCA